MRSFFIYIYTHIRSNLYTRRSAIVVTPTRTRRNNTSGTTLVINVCQPRPNRYRETIEIAATLAPIFFPLCLFLSLLFSFFSPLLPKVGELWGYTRSIVAFDLRMGRGRKEAVSIEIAGKIDGRARGRATRRFLDARRYACL